MDKKKNLENMEAHSDRLNIGYFGWMNRILQNNKDRGRIRHFLRMEELLVVLHSCQAIFVPELTQ